MYNLSKELFCKKMVSILKETIGMIKIISIFFLIISFYSCKGQTHSQLVGEKTMKIHAPEFTTGLDWLNTEKPIKLKDLRGKIVLLDFWTYCCINCMHILPELSKLEEKYKDELVVIGVHSAKFTTEKGTENIRQAILRYNIKHPVVNDKNFEIWREYSANAWPTLVLIDPEGYIFGTHSGEGIFDLFDYNISTLIEKYKGKLNLAPFNTVLEKNKTEKSLLNFPGKISSNNKDLLLITDSNNNRILIVDESGEIKDIIGSGKKGLNDGSFDKAEFNMPQGTVFYNNTLYIADTENHLIRKADLINRTVETISGLGKQIYSRNPKGDAKLMGLNSPWDLTIANNYLFIAMAGPHQIWKINLSNNQISLHAGNGYENIVDSDLLNSQLAQPSGITTDGNVLYFADSEVSAIRKADISSSGNVNTLIGKGLFEYGDKDGSFSKALLQHPLGINYYNNKLYIADTYNNKIKLLDLNTNTISTLAGTGKEGMTDGDLLDASFNEPSGLTLLNDKIYVADTNNDLIRIIDLSTNKVSTLLIKPKQTNNSTLNINSLNFKSIKNISKNNQLYLQLDINNKSKKLNNYIDSFINFYDKDGILINSIKINILDEKLTLPNISNVTYLNVVLYLCDNENEGLCYIRDNYYKIEYNSNGEDTITINN